jgi:glycosyltransferase involved in cell wall biosynthesis
MTLVSVLLPLKGDCPFLSIAIQSLRAQTFEDWELVICRDHINDSSSRYLDDLVETDTRIKIIDTFGLALPSALNKGLDECGGEFIARFDSDDVMLPSRLHSQVLFLQQNPEYVVCGGQIVIVDQYQKLAISSPYYNLNDRVLKRKINYKCPFPHPASTIRTRSLREVRGYSSQYRFAEDYELWFKLAGLGKFANLKEPVLAYRTYASQTSARFRAETRLYMANALVQNLGSDGSQLEFDQRLVTTELFQQQYLALDETKRAIVDKYYGHDPFLADLLCNSPSMRSKKPLMITFFDFISSFTRKLVHIVLRFRVSAYSFITIRPIWKGYITRLSSESEPSK